MAPIPPTREKRPWLPLKHVIGLVCVGLFIAGSLGFSAPVIKEFTEARDAELAEIRGDADIGMLAEMSRAMMAGDREAFISWGEGEVREQLAHLWDETKKIGWENGVVGSAGAAKGSEEFTTGEVAMEIYFDLGFTHERERFASTLREEIYPEGSEEYEYGQGILLFGFVYDLRVEGVNSKERIHSMVPRQLMPWDDPGGVGVARSENAVLFGYADEQAHLDARINDAQAAAAGVLGTDLARYGFVSTPGFAGFYTEDEERYLEAVHGGELPDREWHEAGVAESSITPVFHYQIPQAEMDSWGIFTGMDRSAVMTFLPGHRMNGSYLRTFAHEFAHINHLENISAPYLEDSGNGAHRPAAEGYARYVEDVVAAQHGEEKHMLQPHVREAIATATDVEELVSSEAFDSAATSSLAYNVSANLFAYIEEHGSVADEVMRAEYVDDWFGSWLAGVLQRNGGAGPLDDPVLWQEWNEQ